jgi:iron complex outermembrane receptor protein
MNMKTKSAICLRYGLYAILVLCGLITISLNVEAQVTISGTVIDKSTGDPLPGANLILEKSVYHAVSNLNGHFSIGKIKPGPYTLKVSYVGFGTTRMNLDLRNDTTLEISMEGVSLLGEEVNIVATRMPAKAPVTYSMITGKEIRGENLGKDMPYILQTSPSTVVTSDAGNGVGYSGMTIRGTDLTRINVTINGIPLNDAESQGVWFVDLPDLASSTENIQVQRGVGTSTNGSGAFGASINILTQALNQDPYAEIGLSGGSFNTLKSTLRFGTGLMTGKFSFDGRVSFLRSDGYIDRASTNLKSFYLSGGYFGKRTTVKLIAFSGWEKTYQAWEGVPGDSLETNRTYNPAGEYTDSTGQVVYYSNQTDNYQQDHYQLIFSQNLAKDLNLNVALFLTKGKGYYENYKQDEAFSDCGLQDPIAGGDTITSTDLVNRKMMDNDFYGITFSGNYNPGSKLKTTIGGAWSRYNGSHFGKIIWAEYAAGSTNEWNWYSNTGVKTDFNIYGKASYQIAGKVNLFADLQYRYVHYRMEGTLDDLRNVDQDHEFGFLNPKTGIFVDFSERHKAWGSFGIANREPSRNNYKDADPDHMPVPERLYDYELGYQLNLPDFTAGANLYYMDYRDQLVLTGEINNVGEAVMVNVPRSYRAGIEISAGADLFSKLQLTVTATFSRNRISGFTEYVDNYDSLWNFTGQVSQYLGETDLSFSPSVLCSGILTYKPIPSIFLTLNSRYVGKQFIDNTGNAERSLNAYFTQGFSAGYTFKPKFVKEIALTFTINNLFSSKYESNAWVYRYYQNNDHYEMNGYFPQALINFLAGIVVRI